MEREKKVRESRGGRAERGSKKKGVGEKGSKRGYIQESKIMDSN